ncbi:MAG: response regulator transcription factor [Ignavibacteria bacterium]|nr:response regulator transcription factor [Ignavibacteria bacterium]MBK6773287.1 response regulator transcription factor [Ignavibacteria bacterium]MBK7158450.1 response regulator transcription factor [Ignavibacteria bacterium]MBK7254976.1 response regulator transcription factor [Ignavibacteria bacterium]MBK7444841.1 response regulator transcription factor [Ignavibacteria bacterium]
MKKKILVVDDEKDIVDILKYNLERENEFEVITASNGKEALEAAQSLPDLILLDIMMPELNGFEVCKRLKNDKLTSGIPVIFLTAKENEIDEILGLEIGADDYINKPISPRKVLARIKSVIRRFSKEIEKSQKLEENVRFRNLEIDSSSHSVKINEKEIFFPKKEFQLLHFLISNRGRVYSREILLNQLWGENIYVVDRTVDVHVAKVREKLGEYSDYIETIKGLGYRFRDNK